MSVIRYIVSAILFVFMFAQPVAALGNYAAQPKHNLKPLRVSVQDSDPTPSRFTANYISLSKFIVDNVKNSRHFLKLQTVVLRLRESQTQQNR